MAHHVLQSRRTADEIEALDRALRFTRDAFGTHVEPEQGDTVEITSSDEAGLFIGTVDEIDDDDWVHVVLT